MTARPIAQAPIRPILDGAYALTVAGTVAGAVTECRWLQYLCKPGIGAILGARVMSHGQMVDARLLAAIGASTAGDLAMIESDRDLGLVGGIAAFAPAQILYGELYRSHGGRWTSRAAAGPIAGWLGANLILNARTRTAIFGRDTANPRPGTGAAALLMSGYGLLLARTVTLATDASIGSGRSSIDPPVPATAAVGGALFLISDALILVRRLLVRQRGHRRIAEAAVLATYAAAQSLLVDSLLAATPDP